VNSRKADGRKEVGVVEKDAGAKGERERGSGKGVVGLLW
jgi:hypothetical protein